MEIDLHSFHVYNYSGSSTINFKIEASVKESATGISLSATSVTIPIEETDVELSFSGTLDTFKPGLPFEAVVGEFDVPQKQANKPMACAVFTASFSSLVILNRLSFEIFSFL